jgi:uncharacterized membrane protein YjjP (DUF1212 family)
VNHFYKTAYDSGVDQALQDYGFTKKGSSRLSRFVADMGEELARLAQREKKFEALRAKRLKNREELSRFEAALLGSGVGALAAGEDERFMGALTGAGAAHLTRSGLIAPALAGKFLLAELPTQ